VSDSKSLSAFARLDGIEGVYLATRGGLRCSAIRMAGQNLCVFSPVLGLGDEARLSLSAIGEVTHLLAPNHYHNSGLAEWAAAFPKARLCASLTAAPRLSKQTGLSFDDLTGIIRLLPNSHSILSPDGLKTGEIWVRSQTEAQTAWFVVDALSGPKAAAPPARSGDPEVLKTFPTYGVGEMSKYSGWFLNQLKIDQPQLVIPCHGGIVAGTNLPQKLLDLHAKTFGGR
jgi:hypothetical protein